MRFLAMCLMLGPALLAQPPLPRYEVHRAATPIIIDGKPDEKAWADAPSVELIFPWDAQTGAKQKTTARLLWDDDFLYVLRMCRHRHRGAVHRTRRPYLPR